MKRLVRTSMTAAGALLLLAFAPLPSIAQDSHYWTNQYGTRGNLLGGAVVGSVVDLSAVYYNPGGVSLITDPDIIATSRVFELTGVRLQGSGELDLRLNDLALGVAPGFFAGLLPFGFLGKHVLGYSFLTRYKFDATLRAAGSGTTDVIPPNPPEDDFFVELVFDSRLSESWGGLTWSYPLGRRFGIGATTFLAVRSQRARTTLTGEAFDPVTVTGGITIGDVGYKYYNYRLLWKLGVTYDWMGFSLGLTLTTPEVGLFGSGETVLNTVIAGQDPDGDGSDDGVFVANVQQDLGSTYQSPLSIAGGASYSVGRSTTLHAAAEWFDAVPEYEVLRTEPFVGQSTGDTVIISVTQKLNSVVNWGFGVEHQFTPTFALSGSFRTDRSAIDDQQRSDISSASWNIYFITAGASFVLGGGEITLGLAYGFGKQDIDPLFESPPDEIIDPLPDDATARYSSLRLILAFGF
jgi:hypothetical protein